MTVYVEWVLAYLRSGAALRGITKTDPVSGLILARNSHPMDFPGRIAFFESHLQQRTISGDRTEFLGRNGSTAMPLAMKRTCLSGRIGAGFDPCGAIQGAVDLREVESVEILFVLGAADSIDEAFRLARKFSDLTTAAEELKAVKEVWKERLGAVRVQTPDEAVNVMANGWLLYLAVIHI